MASDQLGVEKTKRFLREQCLAKPETPTGLLRKLASTYLPELADMDNEEFHDQWILPTLHEIAQEKDRKRAELKKVVNSPAPNSRPLRRTRAEKRKAKEKKADSTQEEPVGKKTFEEQKDATTAEEKEREKVRKILSMSRTAKEKGGRFTAEEHQENAAKIWPKAGLLNPKFFAVLLAKPTTHPFYEDMSEDQLVDWVLSKVDGYILKTKKEAREAQEAAAREAAMKTATDASSTPAPKTAATNGNGATTTKKRLTAKAGVFATEDDGGKLTGLYVTQEILALLRDKARAMAMGYTEEVVAALDGDSKAKLFTAVNNLDVYVDALCDELHLKLYQDQGEA